MCCALREKGEILNIRNLPVLNNLMLHISNPRDMTHGRMQVWLSALAEAPGLRRRVQSSEGSMGLEGDYAESSWQNMARQHVRFHTLQTSTTSDTV